MHVQGSKEPLLMAKVNSLPSSAAVLVDFIPLLKTIFHDSPDCVAVYAPDTRVVYANKSDERTWAYALSHTQAPQNNPLENLQPCRDALSKVLLTGQPTTFLLDCQLPTMRRHIHDLISMTAIKGQDETILGVIAIGRDLNDYHERQHQALTEKARFQRALLDSFPFMVWLKDVDSRFLAINNTFAQVIGVTYPEQAIGKNDYDYFPQEVADGYVASDKEVLVSGESKTMVVPIHNDAGDLCWAEAYKSPVIVDDAVVGTVGFARDLSDLKNLQADVNKTKSEYATLVESLPIAISRYDLDYKCIFMNSYSERLIGVPVANVLGKTLAEFWHLDQSNLSAADAEYHLAQVGKTGEPHVFELYGRVHDKNVSFLIRMMPEYNAAGATVGVMMLGNDISEISEYREQLERMVYHDALTSLPNRIMFNERISAAINHARRQQHLLGVLMIDLDHFKSINDTLGHSVGDELLIDVAARILDTLRAGDSVARLGGDEFGVLIQDVSKTEDLAMLANKILHVLALPFYVAGQELFVTASIGIAVYPQNTQHVDDLLKYADVAMYAAKKQGRNNYQFFVQELSELLSQRLQMQTELMHAIEKNEFYLHYQPFVHLKTGEIIGAEALIRWDNQTLGKLSPNEFIPLAEELGIITEIGKWVMMQVFHDAVSLNANREKPLLFAVNLSARQFLRYNIYAAVQYCLSVTGCNPAWIALEITESLLLNDSAHVLSVLRKLEELGIQIAIDDFGTGYSSLSYLNKFPISEVKIDRSFIREITINQNDAKLVKAVIGMAVSLDLALIAEGVETQEQADLLESWGCHVGQGFLFSQPISFEQLSVKLNEKAGK